MKEIELTQGLVALVDDEDFEMLSQFKWCAVKWRSSFYTQSRIGKGVKTSMHRLLMNANPGEIVDHINRNSLDNRRKNLRIVSYAINMLNSGLPKNNTSGFKGAYWNKAAKKWCSYLGSKVDGKLTTKYLGSFDSPEEASAAYQAAVLERYGEF